MTISVVSFSFSWCSTGGPGAQLSAGFLYLILSLTSLISNSSDLQLNRGLSLPHLLSNSSYLQLNRGLRGPPPPGGGFLYHILSLTSLVPQRGPLRPGVAFPTTSYHQLTGFLSSLSYIIVLSPTQSPTQFLEWHVWSSSSRNNCHAVQRSLSYSASVYECIMGFYLVPFRQPNPPARFLSITDHWNVSLPSGASHWNGMFGQVEGQNTTVVGNG